MRQPDIELRTDEVRAHADLLDAMADLIRDARGAAHHVAMRDDAYGQICSARVVPLLNLLETLAIRAIGRAGTSVDALAETLRTVANHTDRADAAASCRLHGGD